MNQAAAHPKECKCDYCIAWFANRRTGTGCCKRCGFVLDGHRFGATGKVIDCPSGGTR